MSIAGVQEFCLSYKVFKSKGPVMSMSSVVHSS